MRKIVRVLGKRGRITIPYEIRIRSNIGYNDMYMLIDDDVFEKASRRSKVDIFSDEDNEEVEEEIDTDESESYEEPAPKIGFFTALVLGLGLAGKNKSHKHNGKCNGDCANCPAHYGYRYGRWYYGHHHNHGCEFGGNGGR